ncbi:MAG: hypothetical protein ACOC8H_00250 [bacterium]
MLRDIPPNVSVVPTDPDHKEHLVRPPGTTYTGPSGMRFQIAGYNRFGFRGAPGPATRDGLVRYHGSKPPTRVLPLVAHVNPSPRLARLYREVDAVTPKRVIVADAAGLERRSRQLLEGLHSASWREIPDTIVVTIDSNDCSEGIIAHEFMHMWLDLVEGYEDHREYRNIDNGQNYFQVICIQSFIIDCKVQAALIDRGFELERFTQDIVDAIYENAVALYAGQRPGNRIQAAFGARILARPFAVPELYEFTDEHWQKITYARTIFERHVPHVVALADRFADAFKRHDYRDRDSAKHLIDECLKLHFDFIQEPLDLHRDLVVRPDVVEWRNKFPHILPNVPPDAKHDILRRLIRDRWPSGTQVAAGWAEPGRLAVRFIPPAAVGLVPPRSPNPARRTPDSVPFFEYDDSPVQGGRTHAFL